MQFSLFFRVRHRIFHDGEIHERLPAEEIHLQNLPVPGLPDEEIHRGARDFVGHIFRSALIFPLSRKTILAAEVAVVADVQTERLDQVAFDRRALFLLSEQDTLLFQAQNLFLDLPHGGFVRPAEIIGLALHFLHDLGGERVADVKRAAPHVEKIVISVYRKSMYHNISTPNQGAVNFTAP